MTPKHARVLLVRLQELHFYVVRFFWVAVKDLKLSHKKMGNCRANNKASVLKSLDLSAQFFGVAASEAIWATAALA